MSTEKLIQETLFHIERDVLSRVRKQILMETTMRSCENGACSNSAEIRMKEITSNASAHNHAYCLKCADELNIDVNDESKVVKLIKV